MSKKANSSNNKTALTLEEDMSMGFVCNVIIDKILSDPEKNIYEKASAHK